MMGLTLPPGHIGLSRAWKNPDPNTKAESGAEEPKQWTASGSLEERHSLEVTTGTTSSLHVEIG